MKQLYPSPNVYLKKSQIPDSGRGVFAMRDISKGESIEVCPVIDIPSSDMAGIDGSFLLTYFFFYGEKKDKILLALGFGSLYNHSYTPNATYKISSNKHLIEFTSLSDIKKDEEITFNYKAGNPKSGNPMWFEI